MLESLITLLPLLSGFLRDSAKKRRLADEHGQRAVEAILRAINETRLYIAYQSRGNARDQKREEELSRRWTDAAGALRGIDDDLARRARLKGEYWTDPDQWDREKVEEARILLTQVEKDADNLLGWSDAR